jgi:uncharacterized membrane protein YdjX (TVP38/TMEM64 family)
MANCHTVSVAVQGDPASAVGGGKDQHEVRPLYAIVATLGGIALLAILILAIDPLRAGIGDAIGGDTGQLREDLRGLGFGGVMIALLLAIAHVVIWYPAEILDLAVGYVYGFWGGLVLAMAGWVTNGLISYWIGRHAARPLLWRFVGRDRFERLESMVEAGGVTLLLGMRLVPVIPFSLFSMVAGAARADLRTFIWTTAVGYLPLTAIFVYLGSRLEELSPTDPVLWLGAAVLIGLLLVTRAFHRRWRDHAAATRGARAPQPESDS